VGASLALSLRLFLEMWGTVSSETTGEGGERQKGGTKERERVERQTEREEEERRDRDREKEVHLISAGAGKLGQKKLSVKTLKGSSDNTMTKRGS
jgi:hypothetical protein